MSKGTIFQASDLVRKRTEFLQAARDGAALLRDKDGTSYVTMPESRINSLQQLKIWSGHLLRLQELLRRDELPTIVDLGELAWLRPFDRDDLMEFVDELSQVLIASLSDEATDVLDEVVEAWKVTAQQLKDPLRASILTGEHSPADFVDADRPDGD